MPGSWLIPVLKETHIILTKTQHEVAAVSMIIPTYSHFYTRGLKK